MIDRHQFEEKGQKKKIKKGGVSDEPSQIRTEKKAPPSRLSQKSRNLVGRYDSYTLLTIFRSQILMEIEGENFLHQSPSMKIKSCDQKCYYCFHHDHGHDTEECHQLNNKIENLIRQGYLGKYAQE